MADTQYPPNYDPKMNIPAWLTFKFATGKEGTTKSKGTPYKKFAVVIGGIEHTWWVYNLALATQIEAILANCRALSRQMEVAYMQTEGEGKAHLHCLSDRMGGLQCTVPPGGLFPKHFADFVGVSNNGGGSVPQQPCQPNAPPPTPSLVEAAPLKTMFDCISEAFYIWREVLLTAYRERRASNDPLAEPFDYAFAALRESMAANIAATAHYLYRESRNCL